ncbi:MAG TPA: hypothetical protein VHC44_18755 [Verrucomicrobiae bacterium]|nr:hypothetical protein [Verrucomicrobiae bacterium]
MALKSIRNSYSDMAGVNPQTSPSARSRAMQEFHFTGPITASGPVMPGNFGTHPEIHPPTRGINRTFKLGGLNR